MKKKTRRTSVTIEALTPDRSRIHRTVHYVSEGCKYYFNAQHNLLQLERGQRAFYDFLCEEMDARNSFILDGELREKFRERVSRVTSKKLSYSPRSLDQYLQVLVDLGLVLRTGKKGYYIVNPKYAFRGTETDRKKLLKKLIEYRVSQSLSIDKLVDVPVEEFCAQDTPATHHPRTLPIG